jgi:hypothetical protein
VPDRLAVDLPEDVPDAVDHIVEVDLERGSRERVLLALRS